MNKKLFSMIGMCVSLAIIILGVLLLANVPSSFLTSADTTYKDSGFATFGTDFYTYINNNAAEAASATQAIAANQNEFFDMLAHIGTIGAFMLIAFGALGFCAFGAFSFSACGSARKENQASEQPSEENDTLAL